MMRQWRASFVMRWHTNPDLCHTHDPIAGHQGRCAVLALTLWPDCSRDLLVACVTHDLGEHATGDIPWGAPNKDNAAEAAALVSLGFGAALSPEDHARLKHVDRLDAYLWMMHHAPHLSCRDDWMGTKAMIDGFAPTL